MTGALVQIAYRNWITVAHLTFSRRGINRESRTSDLLYQQFNLYLQPDLSWSNPLVSSFRLFSLTFQMQRKPVQIQISFFENFEKKNDFDRVTIEDKDEWEMQMHFHFLSEFAKAWPLCRVELTDQNYRFDFRCLLSAKKA